LFYRSFYAFAYFGFAIWLAKVLSRGFYRVRLGAFDESGLEHVDPEATVVFVMNHRSNMDYVLVTEGPGDALAAAAAGFDTIGIRGASLAGKVAAEIVTHLRGMAKRKRTKGPFDPGFDPPHTTVHTGLMHGGTALNIVPKDCYFDFEFRHLPEDDPEELLGEVRAFVETKLLPEMHAIDPATGVRFEQISQIPGLDMKDDDPLTQLVMALSGANSTGKVAFGTDVGVGNHGTNALEFVYMHEAGMSPEDCLKTATINAADLIGEYRPDLLILVGGHRPKMAALSRPRLEMT